jgi:hypothetical protein
LNASDNSLTKAGLLGLYYYLIVFTFAFLMGVARVLVVAPRLGQMAAVMIEVPILIAASLFVSRYLIGSSVLTVLQLALMGLTAFILTMASEALLAELLQGNGVAAWAASLATPVGLLGLAGQVIFALMPIFVGCGRNRKSKVS